MHLWCVSCVQSLGATSHPRAPLVGTTPLHLGTISQPSLSPSHSPQTLLSLAKPWRSSPSSSLAIEALPRRSIAGERQGTTPTSYTAPISSSSLGRSFPQRVLLLLHLLLQAPSKEDDPELLQAFPVALKPLPVSYSTPVSVSPPRSIRIALEFEAKNTHRAQITIDDLEVRNPNACAI